MNRETATHGPGEGRIERQDTGPRQSRDWFWWSILLLSAAYFAWRGPWRGLELSVDLPTFYSAARAWLYGLDPYDMTVLRQVYAAAGGDDQEVLMNVNPPFQFPVLALLGALPYQLAKVLFVGANAVALIVATWRAAVVAGVWSNPVRRKWLLPGVLLLAPIHTTFSQGQLSLVVLMLVVLMLEAHQQGREARMGLLLALAGTLKPQMVVLFGLYYLLTGRWRACLVGAATGIALTAVAIAPMAWAGLDWLAGWRGNVDLFLSAGSAEYPGAGYGDYAVDRPSRFIMINLAPLLYTLVPDRLTVTAISSLIGLTGVLLAAAMAHRAGGARASRVAQYALISLACLLMFYNRTYSATLLLLPGMVGLMWWPTSRRLSMMCVVGLAPFVVPGPAILLRWLASQNGEAALSPGWFWEAILLPHQVYALFWLMLTMGLAWWWPPHDRISTNAMASIGRQDL